MAYNINLLLILIEDYEVQETQEAISLLYEGNTATHHLFIIEKWQIHHSKANKKNKKQFCHSLRNLMTPRAFP